MQLVFSRDSSLLNAFKMLGTRRIFSLTLICFVISFSSCSTSSSKTAKNGKNEGGSFLWRLFSRGKSFFGFGQKFTNSSRRTGKENQHPFSYSLTQHEYDTDDIHPQHRIVNDIGTGPYYYQNSNSNSNPELPQRSEEDPPKSTKDDTGGGTGWGWGWQPTHYQSDHQHMQLYTLLGSLSFASFLATAVVLLTRRNGTRLFRSSHRTNQYFLNNRKHDEEIEQSHEIVIKVPQFIHKISKLLSPWWYLKEREETLDLEPEHKDEIKMTRVPTLNVD